MRTASKAGFRAMASAVGDCAANISLAAPRALAVLRMQSMKFGGGSRTAGARPAPSQNPSIVTTGLLPNNVVMRHPNYG